MGAADDDGERAPFSPHEPWVNLLAPGVRTVSLYFNGVARWSGTSFAAAWLSGEIAARIRPGRTDGDTALHELIRQAGNGDGPPWLP